MKIKVKLTLGVGLLFIFIILLTVVGAVYINALNRDTQNILVANYNTLDYSREMLMALDRDITKPGGRNTFNENLRKQQANITEIGEGELTDKLARDYASVLSNPGNKLIYISIREDLADIMLLNMQAIQRKSDLAKSTAKEATWWIAITGTFCFLIAFTLLVNLPGNIADPIKELTNSIKQIAERNYSERVHFEGRSEFGELANSFNSMAQKLQEYNNSSLSKLMVEKKRIETLINNMHDPVIGLDEKKQILFVNTIALKILGSQSENLIGRPAAEIALTNDLMRALLKEMIGPENTNKGGEPLKIYADNKESYFEKEIIEISIVPTGESTVMHLGHFIVLKNITPFKELDFAKTNFIATISHELKTPIAAIKASLQLLEHKNTGQINEDQKQLIKSIKDDSDRLLKITGELLNLSQVETGNIQLNMQASDPGLILQYALDAVKTAADQKHILLELSKDENLPQVKADTEKTAWVLINLLTNAIRYSHENEKVLISIRKLDKKVRFSVTDFGKGIDAKYVDKIFTRYFQVPGSSKSGTGLGLSISKEFIEGQGGEIKAESKLGEGSTFSFCLIT